MEAGVVMEGNAMEGFTITEVLMLRWYDASHVWLFGKVVTVEYGNAEIMIKADYDLEWGRVFFAAAMNGDYGTILEYDDLTPEEVRAAMPALETWRLDAALQLRNEAWDTAAKIETLPVQQKITYRSQWRNKSDFIRLDDMVLKICEWFTITPETMDEIWNEGLAL